MPGRGIVLHNLPRWRFRDSDRAKQFNPVFLSRKRKRGQMLGRLSAEPADEATTMTEGTLSLHLRNDLSELATLSRNLEEFATSLGLAKRTLFQLNLVIDELVTNIINYAYRDDAEHRITVIVRLDQGFLIIRLEDDGIPFNPVLSDAPDCSCPVERRAIGKLGIHLARQFADDLVYERYGNRNILTITKRVREDHLAEDPQKGRSN
jgi:anti-sigma regulatory factor (Ser/Thr protein kinase)